MPTASCQMAPYHQSQSHSLKGSRARRLLALTLFVTLVACAAARSIDELYRVEVGPHDTAKAVLDMESGNGARKRDRGSSEESQGDGRGDSGEDSDEKELTAAVIACVSIVVVLMCAAAVGVIGCCLYGWCCFKKRQTQAPAATAPRRISAVVVKSSVTGRRPDAGVAEKSGAATATATATRTVLPPAEPPSYQFATDAPPQYTDIVFAPSAPNAEPAILPSTHTHTHSHHILLRSSNGNAYKLEDHEIQV